VRVTLVVDVDTVPDLLRTLRAARDTMRAGHERHGIEDEPGAVANIARLQALIDACPPVPAPTLVNALDLPEAWLVGVPATDWLGKVPATCGHPADAMCPRCCNWPKCPDCKWYHDPEVDCP